VVGAVRTIWSAVGNAEPLGPSWLSLVLVIAFGISAISLIVVHTNKSDNDRSTYGAVILGVASVMVMTGFGIVTAQALLPTAIEFGLFAAAAAGLLLGSIADRREQLNANPFLLCLEAASVQLNDRTSVISS
jgi:hypothetical protein